MIRLSLSIPWRTCIRILSTMCGSLLNQDGARELLLLNYLSGQTSTVGIGRGERGIWIRVEGGRVGWRDDPWINGLPLNNFSLSKALGRATENGSKNLSRLTLSNFLYPPTGGGSWGSGSRGSKGRILYLKNL